jgi:Right handed beta helix region
MNKLNKVVMDWHVLLSQSPQSWGRILTLFLALTWMWAPDIRAGDYWVGRNGRDATGQGSRTRPLATLQYAADLVRPGDTVHVRDGNYEGFDLRHGGSPDLLVAFKADGKQVRIARRNRTTPDGINVEGASYVVIEGFIINEMPRTGVRVVGGSHVTIRGIQASRNGAWGILTGHCDDLVIIGNQVSNSIKEHGIYVGNSGDRPLIGGNVSWGNRGCGIHMNGDASQGGDGIISGARVENNIIYDNGRGGGSAINGDGVQDSMFANNLLYRNHASGISLYRADGAQGPKNNRIVNNTIVMASDARWALNLGQGGSGNIAWNNILLNDNPSRGSIVIEAASLPGFLSDYNVVNGFSIGNSGAQIGLSAWRSSTGRDRHSLVSKPQVLFVNTAAGDFHLRADSPAIDVADPAASLEQDIENHPRPFGAGPDVGAFERTIEPGTGSRATDGPATRSPAR